MKFGITERGDAGYDLREVLQNMKSVDAAVWITKRPDILVKNIDIIPDNVIIHCTITGLAGTVWEPHSIPVDNALNAYKTLVHRFGYNKAVLRVDPIIPTKDTWNKAIHVINHCRSRLRISILDLYNHVRARLPEETLKEVIKQYPNSIHAKTSTRTWIVTKIKSMYPNVEVCGEPGIENTGCISEKDFIALNIPVPPKTICKQRAACACLANKTELLSRKGQCPNKCTYCYWK